MDQQENITRGDLDELAQLISTARLLDRMLNTALAEDGLRGDLWRVMHALEQQPGMVMGEIAETLTLPAATTTRLIDELTDDGLVFRRPAPDDGRKTIVYLSRAGRTRLLRASSLIKAHLPSVPIPAWHRA